MGTCPGCGVTADHYLGLRVVAAPSTGRFRPAAEGERELIGHVTGSRDRADAVVRPSCADHLRVRPAAGQLVREGEVVGWFLCPGQRA